MPALNGMALALAGLVVIAATAGPGADPCFRQAEHLFATGFPDQALTEYMRYLYFQPEGELRLQGLARAACCRRELGELEAALETCRLGAREAGPGDLGRAFQLEAARIDLQLDRHGSADFTASQVLESSPSSSHAIAAHAIRIRAALGGGRYDECRTEAALLVDALEAEQLVPAHRAESWRAQLATLELEQPRRAMALSKLVPGLGQLKVGRPLRAMNALVANGATSWLLIRSVLTQDVGLAIFSAAMLRRFNLGARIDAARVCHEHNRDLLRPVVQPMLKHAEAAAGDHCDLFEAPRPELAISAWNR